VLKRAGWAILIAGTLSFYLAGQRKNPPAFFADESANSYNAYTLATRGVDQWGHRYPLFISAYGEIDHHPVPINPTQIYLLAGVFRVVHPSNLVARRVAALSGYAAALLLAALAWRITHSHLVAAITLLTVIATPMLFEISRLAFEVSLYPLAAAAFLWSVYEASRHDRWSAAHIASITASLLLVAYNYSIGRLLAALLLGLLVAVFATRRRMVALAVIAMLFVALAVIPMALYNHRTNDSLTERFQYLSYVGGLRNHPLQLLAAFEQHYVDNLLPLGMAVRGDPNPRHHVPGSGGSILLMSYVLAVIGAVIGLRRRDRWWIFVSAGTLLSLVPASLTNDQFHTLRLSPFPVFLITLSILALWSIKPKWLIAVLALGVIQAAWFFYVFHRDGADRRLYFDAGVGQVVRDALATGQRPVHLDIGTPVHAYWFAAQQDVDRSVFLPGATAAHGSLVITDHPIPPNVQVVSNHWPFAAYVVP
jgi:hypothetical protein